MCSLQNSCSYSITGWHVRKAAKRCCHTGFGKRSTESWADEGWSQRTHPAVRIVLITPLWPGRFRMWLKSDSLVLQSCFCFCEVLYEALPVGLGVYVCAFV